MDSSMIDTYNVLIIGSVCYFWYNSRVLFICTMPASYRKPNLTSWEYLNLFTVYSGCMSEISGLHFLWRRHQSVTGTLNLTFLVTDRSTEWFHQHHRSVTIGKPMYHCIHLWHYKVIPPLCIVSFQRVVKTQETKLVEFRRASSVCISDERPPPAQKESERQTLDYTQIIP